MSSSNVVRMELNQNATCFTCSCEDGYYVYDVNPTRKRWGNATKSKLYIASPHYKTEWIVLVCGDDDKGPTQMCIWNDRQQMVLSDIKFSKPVNCISHTRTCLAVGFEHEIKIYHMKDLSLLYTFSTNNPHGVISSTFVRNDENRSIFAFPGVVSGTIQIVTIDMDDKHDKVTDHSEWTIKTHEHIIVACAVSGHGGYMATASEHGTMIRVWSLISRNLLTEFRRGSSSTDVHHLQWNHNDTYLLSTSARGTIHIFHATSEDENTKSWMNWASSVLPAYFSDTWSRYKIDLNIPDLKNCIACFSNDMLDQKPNTIVITALCRDTSKIWKFVLNTETNVVDRSEYVLLHDDMQQLRFSTLRR